MNEKDIAKGGFKESDKADLFNYDDGIERIAPLFVIVPYPIPETNRMTGRAMDANNFSVILYCAPAEA